MAVTAMKVKSSVDSVREMVQDFSVPELKAIKATMDGMRIEMQLRDEKQTQAIKHLDEKITESNRHLSENIKQLSDKFDSSVEFRERLAALEAKSARS
jgi:hypothetical protein